MSGVVWVRRTEQRSYQQNYLVYTPQGWGLPLFYSKQPLSSI